jgi:hypothetical protein
MSATIRPVMSAGPPAVMIASFWAIATQAFTRLASFTPHARRTDYFFAKMRVRRSRRERDTTFCLRICR